MGNGVMPNGLSDRAHPRLYLKRPAVAPTEGLLTEALLKHEGAVRTDAIVESPGGLSPPGAPRSVREPLDSYGSRCSAVSMAEPPVGKERWIYSA